MVDPEKEWLVYAKVAALGHAGELKLTAAMLQAMNDLLTASLRVQVFRAAVEWLRDAAGYTSARVPDFSSDGDASNGVIANEIVSALLAYRPTAVGAEQDVVVPAHLLVKNAQDVCMTDDIITVNSIVLARWCGANRPDFRVLHCSFFVQLLTKDVLGLAAMVETVHSAAGGATWLTGVSSISDRH